MKVRFLENYGNKNDEFQFSKGTILDLPISPVAESSGDMCKCGHSKEQHHGQYCCFHLGTDGAYDCACASFTPVEREKHCEKEPICFKCATTTCSYCDDRTNININVADAGICGSFTHQTCSNCGDKECPASPDVVDRKQGCDNWMKQQPLPKVEAIKNCDTCGRDYVHCEVIHTDDADCSAWILPQGHKSKVEATPYITNTTSYAEVIEKLNNRITLCEARIESLARGA